MARQPVTQPARQGATPAGPFARHRSQVLARLRRLARMLAGETALADALVDEVLAGPGRGTTDIARLFALTIAANRLKADEAERPPAQHPQLQHPLVQRPFAQRLAANRTTPDLARAFAALPLAEREALALVAVEGLDYASAATVLGTTPDELVARLDEGRRSLVRRMDGERGVPLRLVK